jgi:hypothetical protein
MSKIVLLNEIDESLNNYKLCYLDEISPTVYRMTDDTREYMKTQEYKDYVEKYGVMWYNPKVVYKDLPNPEYDQTSRTHSAYFTRLDLLEQWGDDWNDVPYDCNAGGPYEDVEGDIIEVPFAFVGSEDDEGYFSTYPLDYKLPKDYGGGNCPWSVEDINLGAVPWLFVKDMSKRHVPAVVIMAGISPVEFREKLEYITKNYGNKQTIHV